MYLRLFRAIQGLSCIVLAGNAVLVETTCQGMQSLDLFSYPVPRIEGELDVWLPQGEEEVGR